MHRAGSFGPSRTSSEAARRSGSARQYFRNRMPMKRPFDQDLPPRGRVVIGLVASPGPASELAAAVRPRLERDLDERFPDIEWSVQLVSSRLVEPPADLSEL